MKYIYYHHTKIGIIEIIEEDGVIISLNFRKEIKEKENKDIQLKETSLLKMAGEQIQEYLMGKRQNFELPIKPKGTEFQQKVWESLQRIPYGETRSYKEIAIDIGNEKACRAVGMANNKNPISIIIPCHRVIGHSGKLVGYGGGLRIKEYLLNLEKENIY